MAHMTVPAEPSYRTTSYSSLKGADFSNDPSLVARNHSPDVLNMISDDGGSPIKRKGWEVTDIDTDGDEITNIWHFQMFGKKWHVALVQGTTDSKVAEFDEDGELVSLLGGTLTGWTGNATGFFFQSADETKTGFYIIAGGIYKVRPATSVSTTLTFTSSLSATVPTIGTLVKYDGTGGVTNGINLLTRDMVIEFWDDRTNNSSRTYRVFNQGSATTIKTLTKVECLKTDGTWENKTSSATVDGTKKIVTLAYNIPVTSNIENVVRISFTANDNPAAPTKINNCSCSVIYSQMTEGQVFVSGNPDYPQYVWYSEIADPLYFPDTNYLFVGGAGTDVTGMIPYGSQIAVLKEPSVTETTIFLIEYTQATDQKVQSDGTTYTEARDVYKVKHGFTGIGSLTTKSVFSLGDEPLFLSQNGIMGMVSNAINSSNSVKNRSGYLDPRLLLETDLSSAIATIHKGYYILVINGHAYILDSRQKSTDYKGNTSYLYESYYWNNIPATAIASDGTVLWFGTGDGRLCRFKETGHMADYSDNSRYGDEPIRAYIKDGETEHSSTWLVDSNGDTITPDATKTYIVMGLIDDEGISREIDELYTVYSWTGSAYDDEYTQAPISAIWSTPLDNDGATNWFKTLQKKGTGCTLYPFTRSSVHAYFEKDGQGEVYVGTTTIDIDNWEDIDFDRFTFIANKAPRDLFVRKKMKKYKRLKIILKNEELDEGFGVQEIFKTYLMARYAK